MRNRPRRSTSRPAGSSKPAKSNLKEQFEALDSQNRYAILHRIQTAKKPETRTRLIEKFCGLLERGQPVGLPALRDAGFEEVMVVDRNPWYRVEARQELERLEGPLFEQVVDNGPGNSRITPEDRDQFVAA